MSSLSGAGHQWQESFWPQAESRIVKVVHIDATLRIVSQIEIEPHSRELIRLCGSSGRPKTAITLPSGDVLLCAEGSSTAPGFTIGGSPTFRSNAVLLGKRDRWRQYTAPRFGTERIEALLRWVEANPSEVEPREGVQAILIDPAQRTIEAVKIEQSLKAVEDIIGEKIVLAFLAPGGDRVYAAASAQGPKWRKDDAHFIGRCVIVGSSEGGLVDVAASLETLKKDVRFAAERSKRWVRHGVSDASSPGRAPS
ncbi:blr2289 [Bradyrhizobium diazoefficiens USDA 110]|uniref:Blr2289 protein n=1 Tax=Bradyrhizobium diazoefficiens (strain JCM 10833 / BCRC 13528 / IAM 13628 / NBRC 14792 / USDA 110) TaxID=224911 RepID=Q89SW1_BRADU|nr:hypothetical protein [Bradyrhizobium diazoefficiens]AND87808.1 hypothetical protein AAV28_08320 [Bradyrhizobium diazoefficiens USDA 110]PDT57871.1 hypothetical protein CO678_31030 [Bradyrhizobium diazoefficiens]QBP21119.1 hypothetical protein Bdiaspc4_11720 [Bradyrhizobium diazoefficiens]QLD45937.1 hypothetical protein HUW42_35315 [Bradyrhizobium diazoefficiens]WLA72270.1 hypothetical protein QIH77_36140 [Bradyrhizobium diazoefficiens]